MTIAEQFDFFEDPAITKISAELAAIKLSTEKVRKSLFGKHADLVKMCLELLARVEQLEGKRDS